MGEDVAHDVTWLAAGARALDVLRRRVPNFIVDTRTEYGEVEITVAPEHLREVALVLRDDEQALYTMALCVTAVDYPERTPRFDVLYQLRSMQFNDTVRLVVPVEGDEPHVPSLEDIWATLDWHERETYDLLGIVFDGHHHLQRILLPTDWEGHPLRKDYVSFGEPVAFTHNIEWALPAAERPADMPGEHRS